MRYRKHLPAAPALAAAIALSLAAPAPGAAQGNGQIAVRIDGVGGDLRRNVRQRLSIVERARGIELLDVRIRQLHRQAESEIHTALQPFGYYRPEVDASLERTGDRWVARYRIRPRDRVRLVSLDLRVTGAGSDDPEIRSQIERFPIRPGEPLRHPPWTRAKEALLHRATARGYLDASLSEHGIDVDLASYEARGVLHLETGPRYRFGPVHFEGSDLSRELLARFVPFETGDPFVLERLLAAQSSLASSAYFRRVEVVPRRDEARGLEVPITVTLQQRSRTGVSAGVGYATDTGPRGTFTWDRRWLGPEGERVHGEVRASPAIRAASANYIIPVGRTADDQLAVTAAARDDESFENARSRSLQASGAFSHTRWGWREALSLSLKSEWFDVGERSSRSTLFLPEASWSRTRADQALAPTRASRVTIRTSGTHETIGSDVTFAQLGARGEAIRSPMDAGRVLARVELGTTAVDEIDELPVSHRFFAGGDRSVRGFRFNAIGPRNAAGDVIGGRHLLTASLEVDHRIYGPLAAAAFADVGNAFTEVDGLLELESGVGTGLRWRSPVGPVKLDVAWAVSRSGKPVRLHFSVGSVL